MIGRDDEEWVTERWHDAKSDPSSITGDVGDLLTYLDDEELAHEATWAVKLVAEAHPDAVEPHLSTIVEFVRSGDTGTTFAIETVGLVAEEYPETAADAVPVLADEVRRGDERTEREAVESLRRIAAARPEAVATAVDALTQAVAADGRAVRESATAALGDVARADPDAAAAATDALVDRLQFEYDEIRTNAVRALGHIGDPGTVGEIEPLTDDDEPAVRTAAKDALEAIREGDRSAGGDGGPPDRIPGVDPVDARYDSFDRVEELAAGGGRQVTEARIDGERVALVELASDRTLASGDVGGFLEAVEIWSKLDTHDHVVTVRDWDDQPLPWVAVEHMELGSLADRDPTDLDADERVWTAARVADAFHHAHRYGIYHRTFSPSDLLFTDAPGESWPIPKVTDWELGAFLRDRTDADPDPRYAAPEQRRGDDGDDITDIYRLGAVLYELFTGSPPVDGDDVEAAAPRPASERDATVPDGVDEVLSRALATDRAERYETVVDLRRDLEALR